MTSDVERALDREDSRSLAAWGARFDAALRGYDRAQVDLYVDELTSRLSALRDAVAGAEKNAHNAREDALKGAAELTRTRARLVDTEQRLAQVQAQPDLPGQDGAERVMRLAELTAEALRAEAAEAAAAVQREANEALEAAHRRHAELLEAAAVEK
uniref:DivIVA domain-containing protein n=1 Tax=Sporichthya sp. TaxID=65475 RepID=UPI0017B66B2A